jgi:hypothetical protein
VVRSSAASDVYKRQFKNRGLPPTPDKRNAFDHASEK